MFFSMEKTMSTTNNPQPKLSLSTMAPAFLTFPGGALVPRFFDEEIARRAWVAINRPENWIFLNRYLPQTYEAQVEWLRKPDTATSITFFIRHDQEIIGGMGIHDIDYIHRRAVTGTLLWESQWRNRGIATMAKLVLLDYAFNTLNLEQVYSKVIGYNGRSARYSDKCGYREVARLPDYFRFGTICADELVLLATRDSWLPYFTAFEEQYRGTAGAYQTRSALLANDRASK
jgi:RimJ/RimL family protein N-acetyltransferase